MDESRRLVPSHDPAHATGVVRARPVRSPLRGRPSMRACHAVAILGAVLVGTPAPSGAQPTSGAQSTRVPVCPSLALAQQVQQTPGAPLPGGCRMVGVRRVDTPTGPVCAVDFGEEGQGLFADIMDATVQTRWWTACANLSPP